MKKVLKELRGYLKYLESQLMLIGAALPFAWLAIPKEWQKVILEYQDGKLVLGASAICIASIILRGRNKGTLDESVDKTIDKISGTGNS